MNALDIMKALGNVPAEMIGACMDELSGADEPELPPAGQALQYDLPEPASGSSEALEEQLKAKEGEAILAKIRPGDRVIAMTIGGKRRSSEELAKHLEEMKTAGVSRFVFVIGGSLGLGKNVLARADEEMSMSDMTFPHQLARVMLLEQLYRAEKINAGERYHK